MLPNLLWAVNVLTYTSLIFETDTVPFDLEPCNRANYSGMASAVLLDLTLIWTPGKQKYGGFVYSYFLYLRMELKKSIHQ